MASAQDQHVPHSRARDAKELYLLKEKAMQYYSDNGVPKKMEDILNSMFHDNPPDVYGHLANYFEGFAKDPIISRVKSQQAYDCKGQPTIMTDVYCTIKNKEKHVCTSILPSALSTLLDNAKPEDHEVEDSERQTSLTTAINYINTKIDLSGMDPTLQEEADDVTSNFILKLKEEKEAAAAAAAEAAAETAAVSTEGETAEKTEEKTTGAKKGKPQSGKGGKNKPVQNIVIPEEPKEQFVEGSELVSAVSLSVCLAGASVKGVPVYRHIAALKHKETLSSMNLPLPMATILQSGKASNGKLNCIKEFMVIPKPGVPMREGVKQIVSVYNQVSKTLSAKGGASARLVNDIGALCPTLDKPEQALDMLQEAMTAVGLTPGDDINIGLNIAAHEMFDFDKGKYEVVTGQLKTAEDYVEYLVDLLGRYPAVNAVIDPLRKQDSEQWMRLCDRISVAGYVIGDHGYHRPGVLKNEELDKNYQTSGYVVRWEQMNTLSDILTVTKMMEDTGIKMVVASGQGDTTGDILADLAVGMDALFLKLGAPCRERIAKLNRLLQIESELEEEGMLGYHESHIYPRIELPPPPSALEMEAEDEPPSSDRKEDQKK